ncbi:GntR family transcriptional regulator [Microbulbifer sp.]|uniref:GntR family transcriptional regulator n=1 Tax=Microbulbifer sp. TaxID=1908541 RepID=UPI003F38B919
MPGYQSEALRAGTISPGDPLPSIRQLSRDQEMNSKTVAKAYRWLERDAVIQRGLSGHLCPIPMSRPAAIAEPQPGNDSRHPWRSRKICRGHDPLPQQPEASRKARFSRGDKWEFQMAPI